MTTGFVSSLIALPIISPGRTSISLLLGLMITFTSNATGGLSPSFDSVPRVVFVGSISASLIIAGAIASSVVGWVVSKLRDNTVCAASVSSVVACSRANVFKK